MQLHYISLEIPAELAEIIEGVLVDKNSGTLVVKWKKPTTVRNILDNHGSLFYDPIPFVTTGLTINATLPEQG